MYLNIFLYISSTYFFYFYKYLIDLIKNKITHGAYAIVVYNKTNAFK